MSIPFIKIVVIGEGRVGKTSMSLKFVEDKFDQKQKSTINASYLQKLITLDNKQKVTLAIWDTAGQQMYNAVVPVYYRDAYGAIVVFEIGSVMSFEKVKKWITQLKQYAEKDIVIYIAGNKCDMQTLRKVPKGEAETYAKNQGCKYFQVSAKTGQGIDKIFTNLSQQICQVRGLKTSTTKPVRSKPRHNGKSLVSQPQKEPQQKKCC